MLKIQVILGSIRPGRAGEKVFNWAKSQLQQNSTSDVEYEFVDLKDWNLPIELEAKSPSMHQYEGEETKRWAEKISEGDGYIIITPEYNHGYPAALKNALDHIYAEWNNKPIAFISYGGAGGVRAVEQLRLVAIELQMAPIRAAVYIPTVWEAFDEQGNLKEIEKYNKQLTGLVQQLLWWATALKTAREKTS